MVNAQEWLEIQEEYNTKEKRAEIKKLDLDNKKLEGELNLKEFVNLENFNCSSNQLTEIDLSNNSKLIKITCHGNQLVKLKITNLFHLKKLDCWIEQRENNTITSAIPLERLYVIRGNIKNFVNKWGFKKGAGNLSEISKLKNPDESWNYRRAIYISQFIGRGSGIAGLVLTFYNQSAIGGGILAIYPFTELVASRLEEDLKKKENKWNEFLRDTNTFLDSYNGLLGILAQFEIDESKKGKVNESLQILNKKAGEFFKDYDEDVDYEKDIDKEINIDKLIAGLKKFIQDLNKEKKSKAWGIAMAIKEVETETIEYRKSSHCETNEEKIKETISCKPQQATIDLDEHSIQESRIEIPPK